MTSGSSMTSFNAMTRSRSETDITINDIPVHMHDMENKNDADNRPRRSSFMGRTMEHIHAIPVSTPLADLNKIACSSNESFLRFRNRSSYVDDDASSSSRSGSRTTNSRPKSLNGIENYKIFQPRDETKKHSLLFRLSSIYKSLRQEVDALGISYLREGNPYHESLVNFFMLTTQRNSQGKLRYQTPNNYLIINRQGFVEWQEIPAEPSHEDQQRFQRAFLTILRAVENSFELGFVYIQKSKAACFDLEGGIVEDNLVQTNIERLFENFIKNSFFANYMIVTNTTVEFELFEFYWKHFYKRHFYNGILFTNFFNSQRENFYILSNKFHDRTVYDTLDCKVVVIQAVSNELRDLRDNFKRKLQASMEGITKQRVQKMLVDHNYSDSMFELGNVQSRCLGERLMECGKLIKAFCMTVCSKFDEDKRNFLIKSLNAYIPDTISPTGTASKDKIVDFDNLGLLIERLVRENIPKEKKALRSKSPMKKSRVCQDVNMISMPESSSSGVSSPSTSKKTRRKGAGKR